MREKKRQASRQAVRKRRRTTLTLIPLPMDQAEAAVLLPKTEKLWAKQG